MPFAPGGVASQPCSSLLLRVEEEWRRCAKEIEKKRNWGERNCNAGETGQEDWKFLLPLRFHFTPNHTTIAGFILNVLLMRFATVTVVDIFKTADQMIESSYKSNGSESWRNCAGNCEELRIKLRQTCQTIPTLLKMLNKRWEIKRANKYPSVEVLI